MNFSPDKTEALLISNKANPQPQPSLQMNGINIDDRSSHKHLGLTFNNNLSWSPHIDDICGRVSKKLDVLRGLAWTLDRKTLEILYKSYIRSIIEYGNIIYADCCQSDSQKLELLQKQAIRIITGCTMSTSSANLYRESCLESLEARRKKQKLIMFYKILNNQTGTCLSQMLPQQNALRTGRVLRNLDNYTVPLARTTAYKRTFFPSTTQLWNNLPMSTKNSLTLNTFKSKLNNNLQSVPKIYYCGTVSQSRFHCRLRNECSNLNKHFFLNHIALNPAR